MAACESKSSRKPSCPSVSSSSHDSRYDINGGGGGEEFSFSPAAAADVLTLPWLDACSLRPGPPEPAPRRPGFIHVCRSREMFSVLEAKLVTDASGGGLSTACRASLSALFAMSMSACRHFSHSPFAIDLQLGWIQHLGSFSSFQSFFFRCVFQWFLMSLSVLSGRYEAIAAHLFPSRAWRSVYVLCQTIESSTREFVSRNSTLAATVYVSSEQNFVELAVIRKFSEGRNGHIPYRDSKLTRILQSPLGGNARTAIICTMSPARSHVKQSRNTLFFANRAKQVVTNAQVNVMMSDKALIKHLLREVARFESELSDPGSTSCTSHFEVLRDKDSQIQKVSKDELRQSSGVTFQKPYIAYRSPDIESRRLCMSHESKYGGKYHLELCGKLDKDQDISSPSHSVISAAISGLILQQRRGKSYESFLKHLRREREMLYRQMQRRLTLQERIMSYNKWGINLNSKQRRLQLAQLVSTKTETAHAGESASLVGNLIGLEEQGQALKEMFGLSFLLPQQTSHRHFISSG
ncbi:hypothetical protein ZIOFF_061456 [Zingiber officinale]|uniref:Kinesin motor domain-containing protein n=1 Tax=Zingiber officinale TaxID=94328 RepID=A0A8J5F8I8_ZINOF|nr:hypothetical protein ZIOFF_061456 [Zingiber officinale]